MNVLGKRDETAQFKEMLASTRTIAVIGASPRPDRASHDVMGYMQRAGYRTIPVNPSAVGRAIHGERVYERLSDVAGSVEMVNVFRASDTAGQAVDDAIAAMDRLGIRFVWMQLGVINMAAARRAEDAGLTVVMDRCLKIEHALLGADLGR